MSTGGARTRPVYEEDKVVLKLPGIGERSIVGEVEVIGLRFGE